MKKLISLLFAVVLVFTFASCNTGELEEDFTDNGEQYEIVFYTPMGGTFTGFEKVQNAINQYLPTVLPATTLKMMPIAWFEYTGKLSPIIGASSSFDLCFTSPDINNYLSNVGREAFYPVDKLMDKFAPQTKAMFNADLWECAKVKGKTYAVLNNQILPRTASACISDTNKFNAFLAEKFGANVDKENVYTRISSSLGNGYDYYSLIEDYANYLSKNNIGKGANGKGIVSGINPASTMQTWYGFDDLGTGAATPGVVRVKDNSATVIDQYESAEFDYMINKIIEWRQSGLIPADIANRGNNSLDLDVTNSSTWKPGDMRLMDKAKNIYAEPIRLGDPVYYNAFVTGTMLAISSTSKNPARAMKFIELLHTDEKLHNLLVFGIEGEDYEKSDVPGKVKVNPTSNYVNSEMGWAYGNQFLSMIKDTQNENVWSETQIVNDTAYISGVIGFSFDPTPVQAEIAACNAVYNRYFDSSQMSGLCRADTKQGDKEANLAQLAEFKSRMKNAGSQKIIEEKQRQLNEWLENKK